MTVLDLPPLNKKIKTLVQMELIFCVYKIMKSNIESSFSICALSIFPEVDVSLPRAGLNYRGVAISTAIDFIDWAEGYISLDKIIIGGLSNGGHIAEDIAVISIT